MKPCMKLYETGMFITMLERASQGTLSGPKLIQSILSHPTSLIDGLMLSFKLDLDFWNSLSSYALLIFHNLTLLHAVFIK
jgi:hypothetical protein